MIKFIVHTILALIGTAFILIGNAHAQESSLDKGEKFKVAQKKLEKCQDELADIKEQLNKKENRLKDLEKNPNQRSGTDTCGECHSGKEDLFVKWNQNLDSIKSRNLDDLTNEEKIIKQLCKEKDSCKAVNPYAHYKGKADDLLGKTIEDKGGSCGVLYDYSISMSGSDGYKSPIRLYEVLLSKTEQETVNACWYVKNKLEYSSLQVETKKDVNKEGKTTLFAQFKDKQIECNKLEEKINDDDFSIFNLPTEESRESNEPKVEDLEGSKKVIQEIKTVKDTNKNSKVKLEH